MKVSTTNQQRRNFIFQKTGVLHFHQCKIVIAFDGIIVTMNQHLEAVVRRRKLDNTIAFIAQSHFWLFKSIALNATHYFIMKIPNNKELQQIASNQLSDINIENFIKLYRVQFNKPFSIVVNETTFQSNNPPWFRKTRTTNRI